MQTSSTGRAASLRGHPPRCRFTRLTFISHNPRPRFLARSSPSAGQSNDVLLIEINKLISLLPGRVRIELELHPDMPKVAHCSCMQPFSADPASWVYVCVLHPPTVTLWPKKPTPLPCPCPGAAGGGCHGSGETAPRPIPRWGSPAQPPACDSRGP